jgi:2-keto-4-pentenoate hydratase
MAFRETLAGLLEGAARDRRALAPLTDAHDLSVAGAYAVQDALVARRVARGERVVGAKLGFTSRAMREAMGVTEPNYGWLTDAMVLDGPRLDAGALIHPRVEPEIGFRLGTPPRGPGARAADVLAATEAVFPCLEVVDSRFAGYRFRVADNIADNSSAARLRCGPETPPDGIDLRRAAVVLELDGEPAATATGAAALGDPAAAVAWLVNALHAAGRALEPGSIVISGGLTAAFPIAAGSRVAARIDGLGVVELDAA